MNTLAPYFILSMNIILVIGLISNFRVKRVERYNHETRLQLMDELSKLVIESSNAAEVRLYALACCYTGDMADEFMELNLGVGAMSDYDKKQVMLALCRRVVGRNETYRGGLS